MLCKPEDASNGSPSYLAPIQTSPFFVPATLPTAWTTLSKPSPFTTLRERAVSVTQQSRPYASPRPCTVQALRQLDGAWVRAWPPGPEPTCTSQLLNKRGQTGSYRPGPQLGKHPCHPPRRGAERPRHPRRRPPAGAAAEVRRARGPRAPPLRAASSPQQAPRRALRGTAAWSPPAQRGPPLPWARGPCGTSRGTHTPAKDAATNEEGSAAWDGRGKGGPRGPRTGSEAAGSTTRQGAGDAARGHTLPRGPGPPRDAPRGSEGRSEWEIPAELSLSGRSWSKPLGTAPAPAPSPRPPPPQLGWTRRAGASDARRGAGTGAQRACARPAGETKGRARPAPPPAPAQRGRAGGRMAPAPAPPLSSRSPQQPCTLRDPRPSRPRAAVADPRPDAPCNRRGLPLPPRSPPRGRRPPRPGRGPASP